MKCDVCGLDGAKPVATIVPKFIEDHVARKTRVEWLPGTSPGASCSPGCTALLCVAPSFQGNPKTPAELRTAASEKTFTARMWAARRAANRKESK